MLGVMIADTNGRDDSRKSPHLIFVREIATAFGKNVVRSFKRDLGIIPKAQYFASVLPSRGNEDIGIEEQTDLMT